MLEALSLVCDPCSGHNILDGVMLVCDPCGVHISTENDIWMMVVMPLELIPWMALLMMWRWPSHLDGAPVIDDGPLLDDDAPTCRRCLGNPLEMMWRLVKPTMPLHVPMKSPCS